MTNTILRTGHTGEFTSNGGLFAAHQHSEAVVSLAPAPPAISRMDRFKARSAKLRSIGSRVALTAVAATVALTVLAGCSAISTGTVTGKEDTPGHFITTTSCSRVGKVTSCHPVMIWIGEQRQLDLKQGDKTGWVDVSEKEYSQYSVGDHYGKTDH